MAIHLTAGLAITTSLDGTGTISGEEFLSAIAVISLGEVWTVPHRLQIAFRFFDRRGKGTLEFNEVQSLLLWLHGLLQTNCTKEEIFGIEEKSDTSEMPLQTTVSEEYSGTLSVTDIIDDKDKGTLRSLRQIFTMLASKEANSSHMQTTQCRNVEVKEGNVQ